MKKQTHEVGVHTKNEHCRKKKRSCSVGFMGSERGYGRLPEVWGAGMMEVLQKSKKSGHSLWNGRTELTEEVPGGYKTCCTYPYPGYCGMGRT